MGTRALYSFSGWIPETKNLKAEVKMTNKTNYVIIVVIIFKQLIEKCKYEIYQICPYIK